MISNFNKLIPANTNLPWLAKVTMLLILVLLPFILSSYGLSLLTKVLIFGLFAMSLDILVGFAGLVPFNHATFFGVAAYTVGILVTHGFQNFWLLLIPGITMPVFLAGLLGLLILRSSGAYFLMITLAFGQMVFALAWKWRSLTGGDDGLPGIGRPEIGLPISMWNEQNFYFLVLIFFIGSFLLITKIIKSPFGKSIVGTRENELRMQSLGYNTWLIKYIAYIIAGGFAALAGILYTYFNGFISPQELDWTMSGYILLMVIIGGAGTLVGPVVGAAVIIILQNLISAYTELWPLFMGLIFIVCVLFARDGILGSLLKLYQKRLAENNECIRSDDY